MKKYNVRIVDNKRYINRFQLYVDGKVKNLEEFAEYLGLHISTLKNAVYDNRKQHIIDWLIKKEHGMRPLCKVFWYGCDYQFADDVIEASNIHPASASTRLKRWVKDGDTDRLYRPKQTSAKILKKAKTPYMAPIAKAAPKRKPKKFDRLIVCFRDRGTERCKRYSNCQDHRLDNDGRHHPRRRADGSCYDGERLKQVGRVGSGQRTDKIQHIVNRY